ncbi:MAG: hypothetical protein JJU00_00710 [Opitutales bacterium]|nr:hypothetical protein [Opitutales bacterium]
MRCYRFTAAVLFAAVIVSLCGCRMPRTETPAPERSGLEGTVIVPGEPPPTRDDTPDTSVSSPVPEASSEAVPAPPVDRTPEAAEASAPYDADPPRATPPPDKPEPEPVLPAESFPKQLPAAFAAEPPVRTHRPVPVFPHWADIDEILGSHAVFRVDIDERGNVLRAELIETTAEDNVEPAREALLESRYRPVRSPAGVPIRATIVERIEF